MPNITQVGNQNPWVRMMLYAYPGWRKTSFIATGAEAGMKTLIIRSPMDQIPARALKSGAEQCIVNTWDDMMGGDGILDYLRTSDHGYEWVWFDCFSIIQDVLLDDVWAAVIAEKEHRASLTPSGGLDRGEYGRNMERLQQFIRHVVGVNNFHFGMTAHPFEDSHPTNDQADSLLVPYIQGKNMTPKICGYCNLVAFLELKENDDQRWSRLHVRENSRFYAKDLYDMDLPKGYMDNPTIAKLMEKVEEAQKRQPRTRTRRERDGVSTTTKAKPRGRRGTAKAASGRRGRREQ